MFVSRDKQAQNQAARRLKTGMRVVMALGGVTLAVGFGLFIWFYLAPYFHEELSLGVSGAVQAESSAVSQSVSGLVTYDEMGLTVYGDEVCLFVINENAPAQADFSPELSEEGGVRVDSRIAEAMRLMTAAAKGDGLALTFTEGFVSYDQQERLFQQEVDRLMQEGSTAVMARTEAKARVPMAGECDFQTGLCLRLSGDPETFGDSRTCSWLRANMGKYGFVFRYPQDKEEYTGCKEDLTVIRYVGSAHASAMQQRSMCLEEYLAYLGMQ